MSASRLKPPPHRRRRRRIAPANALLIFLSLTLVALCGCMGLWLYTHKTAPTPAESDTVSIGGEQVAIDKSLPSSTVEEEEFATENDGTITYSGESVYGVDVSSHQGEVDWPAVAADGTEFAMLRVGFRGYTAGAIQPDERFEENYAAARDSGLMVGVYFFSQALNAAEAEEEARAVLDWLDGRALECPVAYDWEPIENVSDARTNGMDPEAVTDCAVAFCDAIEQGGYDSMVYCNGMLGYLSYDVSRLTEYQIWYAEYSDWPSFAYAFAFWQFTDSGTVSGIEGNADRNIWFRRTVS